MIWVTKNSVGFLFMDCKINIYTKLKVYIIPFNQTQRLQVFEHYAPNAVSYTHLDVYKRQVCVCVCVCVCVKERQTDIQAKWRYACIPNTTRLVCSDQRDVNDTSGQSSK